MQEQLQEDVFWNEGAISKVGLERRVSRAAQRRDLERSPVRRLQTLPTKILALLTVELYSQNIYVIVRVVTNKRIAIIRGG